VSNPPDRPACPTISLADCRDLAAPCRLVDCARTRRALHIDLFIYGRRGAAYLYVWIGRKVLYRPFNASAVRHVTLRIEFYLWRYYFVSLYCMGHIIC
jgi:hypothetical protein